MKQLTFSILFTLLLTSFGLCQIDKKLLVDDNTAILTVDSLFNLFIMHWVGKPYRLGGRTEKGIDCSQFNKRLAKEIYKVDLSNTCNIQWKETQRVEKSKLQVGDLVFFKSYDSPSGWHCGTYIGDNSFIHAANKHEGVKISSLSELNDKLSYKGAGRYKN